MRGESRVSRIGVMTDYAAEQEMEMEALEAILMGELISMLPCKGSSPCNLFQSNSRKEI